MQKVSKWVLCASLSAIVMTGLAGCGNGEDQSGSDNAVPAGIQSPVMNKADDKAVAGTDTSNATGNSTSNATGNSAMSKGASKGKPGAAPAPNTAKQ